MTRENLKFYNQLKDLKKNKDNLPTAVLKVKLRKLRIDIHNSIVGEIEVIYEPINTVNAAKAILKAT